MSTATAEPERSELTIEQIRDQIRIIRGLCRNGSYPPPPADVIAAGDIATKLDFAVSEAVYSDVHRLDGKLMPLVDALRALGIAIAAPPKDRRDVDAFGWSATTIAEMLAEMVGLTDNDYTGGRP